MWESGESVRLRQLLAVLRDIDDGDQVLCDEEREALNRYMALVDDEGEKGEPYGTHDIA